MRPTEATTGSDGPRLQRSLLRFTSTASAQRLYDLLADAPSWPDWFAPARRVRWVERASGTDPVDAVAVRLVHLGPCSVREAVLVARRPEHHAYQILSGLPVRKHRADVRFEATALGTEISWSMEFVAGLPGTGWLLRTGLSFGVSRLARALIAAAEA